MPLTKTCGLCRKQHPVKDMVFTGPALGLVGRFCFGTWDAQAEAEERAPFTITTAWTDEERLDA